MTFLVDVTPTRAVQDSVIMVHFSLCKPSNYSNRYDPPHHPPKSSIQSTGALLTHNIPVAFQYPETKTYVVVKCSWKFQICFELSK